MRIAIDIDGVLADFNRAAHAVLSTACAMRPLPPDGNPEQWEWYRFYGATDEAIAALRAAMATDTFWEELCAHDEFGPEAQIALAELEDTATVSFVTARDAQSATQNWLSTFVWPPHVICTPHYKPLALAALEPHIVIEDNARTLLDFVDVQQQYRSETRCRALLVARPYNRVWHSQCAARGIEIVPTTAYALTRAQEMTHAQ